MFTVYEAKVNSDSTEGRGPMRTTGLFTDLDEAVKSIKGKGVMGYGDGEVYETVVYDSAEEAVEAGKLTKSSTKIYGHHLARDGKWRDGFVDDRDLVVDPEYAEYVRLARKFRN